MKTLDEWLQKYATTESAQFDLRDLIVAVRREAFERCEQVAKRADIGGIDPQYPGAHVAERIAKVYREEGQK